MSKRIHIDCFNCLLLVASDTSSSSATQASRTIIYDGVATEVAALPPSSLAKSADLWVTLADLARATRFEIKPKGVCRDELCFPIPKARQSAFLLTRSKVTWFNLNEFARLVRQPVAYDEKHQVWYFGPRREVQNEHLTSLQAPDFKLPDINGKLHALSDFRGKKVLLITWASW
jgi:hypothetical protein